MPSFRPSALSSGALISGALLTAITAVAIPSAALAQDSGKRTRVTLGAQTIPSYPGADARRWIPWIDIDRARPGEDFTFEAADDSFGISAYENNGFAIGPAVKLIPGRTAKRAGAPLPKVDLTVEVGGFIQQDIGDNFRLHGEVRQAVNGHDGLVAVAGGDVYMRDGDEWLFAVGPRVKWANGSYQDAYYGVTPETAVATGLPVYDTKSGIYAVGLSANAEVQMTPDWGLFTFTNYDRIVGNAGDSPVVRELGSRNQLTVGAGVSYTFGR